ncbi:hypothetical protein [Clostridium saccharobutylicum]|uniref:hypothetical protein n=1 Tax=Clostridium saccharobutylicum TaxID=169679 RepID=UPI0012DA6BF4|nr:hypothetical protein [Clostridium saccharobutylicum]MBA2904813.1 hypothetical protein [Clostridium saccharobutylicum]MBA8789390.1 hypothetical protein [Clostridium saccharobutylicum]MBA8896083.1 hypothetical protein [Clostridium saccharobutylicum]MBA8981230.1 hypothetical protein [Clostridium saccharobutylicum]MBA8993604.1 hypothetical protein [Clostridium saccharobutylicum]
MTNPKKCCCFVSVTSEKDYEFLTTEVVPFLHVPQTSWRTSKNVITSNEEISTAQLSI